MESKRSTLHGLGKESKPHIKQKPAQPQKPYLSINKFATLARAYAIIKNNPKKYKGLLAHAHSQFKNYAREIEESGLYNRDQLRQVYIDSIESQDPRLTKRAARQIETYQRRKKFINIGTGIATVALAGTIALTSMLNNTQEDKSEVPSTSIEYTQQYEQNEQEYEFEYEAQPKLSREQFEENYKTESKQQSQNALWTIQFFEGTRQDGHQTVGQIDGMSFGKIQHNFNSSAQTANDLLKTFFKKYPDSALAVFGSANLKKLEDLLKKPAEDIEKYMTENFDYWQPIFKDKLLVNKDFISMLDADIEKRISQAHALCDRYELTSALAFEFAFNNVVLAGHKGSQNNFAILDTIDRENLTPEMARTYLQEKFANRFASRPDFDKFMNAKCELINSLSDAALFDYYFLNIIEDQAPDARKATRSKSILGLDAKVANGEYQHGYDVYKNTWFTSDLTKLEQPRMPETEIGLQEALYNAGYSLDDTKTKEPIKTTTPQNDKSIGN